MVSHYSSDETVNHGYQQLFVCFSVSNFCILLDLFCSQKTELEAEALLNYWESMLW